MNEAAFSAAVLNPDRAVPAGLVGPRGHPAGKRFDVYRNNVTAGLTRVLEAGFPVVRKLVGEEFFAAMGGEFLRRHPPTSRIMMLYGTRFPDFLAGFSPVRHLGYLPDVARLELSLRQSYHAADPQGSAAQRLAAVLPAAYAGITLRLAPSLIVLQSAWPILSIWRANTEADAPAAVMRAEDVVILRHGFDPRAHLLPKGGLAFLQALLSARSLADAIAVCDAEPADLTALIALLLDADAITDIEGPTD